MYAYAEGREVYHPSEAVEKYRRNIMDIYKRKEWKSSGQGALFMGGLHPPGEAAAEEINAQVEALYLLDEENLLYGANMENSCGIYVKDPREPQAPDRFILRRTDTRLFYLDYEPGDKLLALSVSDGPLERHLALCHSDKGDFQQLTEGESLDIMPAFSRRDPQTLYFSSAGIYFDPRRHTAVISSYAINRLDLRSGAISEVAAEAAYDLLRPREAADGALYCLRRPKQAKTGGGFSPLDIVLVPFRLLKAIFSWLNFFSRRYTGESLTTRSGGVNPAQYQQKTAEEIFIEGNLINAARTLKENTQQGDKFPGIAPKSWELVRFKEGGGWETVKKGLLDYSFGATGDIVYSNGKFIIRLPQEGGEEKLCPAHLATGLQLFTP
jgi:hypothetical protein